jgi:hypothetical protein
MIQSNASEDEISSPFYKENKKRCDEFEKYILNSGGTLNGKFNSWSYKVTAQLSETLSIIYKKSTYTSGNLLLSSKYQSLHEQVEITLTSDKELDFFRIRKRKTFDKIRSIFFKDFNFYKSSKNYIIISKEDNPDFQRLKYLLTPVIKANQLFEVIANKTTLYIDLRTPKVPYKFIDRFKNIDPL